MCPIGASNIDQEDIRYIAAELARHNARSASIVGFVLSDDVIQHMLVNSHTKSLRGTTLRFLESLLGVDCYSDTVLATFSPAVECMLIV